jgi:hypothetical protein
LTIKYSHSADGQPETIKGLLIGKTYQPEWMESIRELFVRRDWLFGWKHHCDQHLGDYVGGIIGELEELI